MIKNKKIVLNAFIVFLLGWLLGSFVRKESLTDRQQYYLWQEKCIKKGSILGIIGNIFLRNQILFANKLRIFYCKLCD